MDAWLPILEIAAERLIAFDRFEQGLKISFTETFGAFPLNYLEEQCRTILDRFCENLKKITI